MFLKELYKAAGREFSFNLHVNEKSVVFIPEARKTEISFTPLEFFGDVNILDKEFITKCAEHAKTKFEEMDNVDNILGVEKKETPKEEVTQQEEIPEDIPEDIPEPPKESVKSKYGSMF
jgi:outer membrane biosynthesis protein TonB